MTYINKIVVNGQEVNANQFEGILDKNGNARFVEGELTYTDDANTTTKYAKWSLSGSHLMIVHAFTLSANATESASKVFSEVSLPEWIFNKIYEISESSGGWVSTKIVTPNESTGASASAQAKTFLLRKSTANLIIYCLDAITVGASDLVYRVQFDLLIDNN